MQVQCLITARADGYRLLRSDRCLSVRLGPDIESYQSAGGTWHATPHSRCLAPASTPRGASHLHGLLCCAWPCFPSHACVLMCIVQFLTHAAAGLTDRSLLVVGGLGWQYKDF